MYSIDVRDLASVGKMLDGMREDVQAAAIPAALNKTGDKAKTEMVRAITSEYALPQAEVRPRLRVIKASRGNLVASLDPFASRRRGRSLNLIRFIERKVTLAEGRRRRKAGTQNQLRFRIKKAGALQTIPGAFIANRGRTVFRRVPGKYMPKRINRSGRSTHAQAIEAISTIDVPSMFNTRKINRRVVDRILREFPVELRRALDMVIRRRGG